jgi:hypothetical protein
VAALDVAVTVTGFVGSETRNVARPMLVVLKVRSFVLEDVQVTVLVKLCVDPSEKVPVAVNCCGV